MSTGRSRPSAAQTRLLQARSNRSRPRDQRETAAGTVMSAGQSRIPHGVPAGSGGPGAPPGQPAAPAAMLAVLTAAAFVIFAQIFMVAPILPALARAFATTPGVVGLAVPAYRSPTGR